MRKAEYNIKSIESVIKLNYLFKYGSIASLLVGLILIITALIQFVSTLFISSWNNTFLNNWLLIILKLLAGFNNIHLDSLATINPIDILILVLTGFISFCISLTFSKSRKILSLTASGLPFVGILILLLTQLAGRSSLMATLFVISICMINNRRFNKFTGFLGILSSAFLLLGDISLGTFQSTVITLLFCFGYLLLIFWYFLVTRMLFKIRNNNLRTCVSTLPFT